jgi:hypothetical protein
LAQAPIQPRSRSDINRVRSRDPSGLTDKDNQLKERVRFDVAIKGVNPVTGASETGDIEDIKLFQEALQQSSAAPGSLKSQLLNFVMPSISPALLRGIAIRKNLQDLFDSMGDEDEEGDATLFNGKKIVKKQLVMLQYLRRNSNKKIIEQIGQRPPEKAEQLKNEPAKNESAKIEANRDS